jgi:hypothetical protein
MNRALGVSSEQEGHLQRKPALWLARGAENEESPGRRRGIEE